MANKLSFVLSLFFLMQIIAFAGDLTIISTLYTTLDSLSVSVSHLIAKEGRINEEIREYVARYCPSCSLESLGEETVAFGETYLYRLSVAYNPLIMSKETMVISLTRGAVIGYMDP